MGRQRITSNKRKTPSKEDKQRRLSKKFEEWDDRFDLSYCFSEFIVEQMQRGNSKATISFYKRFIVKYTDFLKQIFNTTPKDTPAPIFEESTMQVVFMDWMKAQGLNVQTVNSYLRGYRAFGNWAEDKGYIDDFKCPIKEVEPPVKEVYSDKELEALMVKPDITNFAEFRTYTIISLILNTGARSNTILNIRIGDVDFEEGYINFNTTKTNKVVRLGLERKTKRDLEEWVRYWRFDKGAEENDYLFCNEYGEKMCRSTLCKSVQVYNNRRNVEKTSIHLLRHTFAKKWITSGGDIITLSKVLTHSELEMVKRYSNLYGTDIKSEILEHSAISQLKQKSGKTLKNQKKRLDEI